MFAFSLYTFFFLFSPNGLIIRSYTNIQTKQGRIYLAPNHQGPSFNQYSRLRICQNYSVYVRQKLVAYMELSSTISEGLWHVQGWQIWYNLRRFTPSYYGSLRPGRNPDSTKILYYSSAVEKDSDFPLSFMQKPIISKRGISKTVFATLHSFNTKHLDQRHFKCN